MRSWTRCMLLILSVPAWTACKTAVDVEDQRLWVSGSGPKKAKPPEEAPKKNNTDANVSEGGDARLLLGSWRSACLEVKGSTRYFVEETWTFQEEGKATRGLSYYSDSQCKDQPNQVNSSGFKLPKSASWSYNFKLGKALDGGLFALDLIRNDASKSYVAALVKDANLTITRVCTRADKSAQLCNEESGAEADQRAINTKFATIFTKE